MARLLAYAGDIEIIGHTKRSFTIFGVNASLQVWAWRSMKAKSIICRQQAGTDRVSDLNLRPVTILSV